MGRRIAWPFVPSMPSGDLGRPKQSMAKLEGDESA